MIRKGHRGDRSDHAAAYRVFVSWAVVALAGDAIRNPGQSRLEQRATRRVEETETLAFKVLTT